MNWISVEDKLPDEHRSILVWTEDDYPTMAELTPRGWRVIETDEEIKVLFWMKIPAPITYEA